MQEILSRAAGDPDYKVTEDKNCLSCHANWHWKEGFEKPPLVSFGVTCESCHGPSSLWKGPHENPKWRKLTPEVKEQEYGFIDVRNPVRRATQCFSCHIGNVQEGKVVTHEMYAAGHPPLPGIELESFTEQMPTHWRLLNEKGEFESRDEYITANFGGPDQSPLQDLPRTKSVIVSGVLALRESINLFASQAMDDDSSHWPELAVFDCSACHHDLAADSWRQKRGYGKSVPGRPQMLTWPTALVKLGIRHRAGDDEAAFARDWQTFDQKMQTFSDVLNRRPFGEPQAINTVVNAEDGLLNWLDQLAADTSRSRVEEVDATRALMTLTSLSPEDFPDYYSARQLAWAVRVIRSEMLVSFPELKPRPQDETDKQSIARALENLELFAKWKTGPRAEATRKVDALFESVQLNDRLKLNLPAGDKYVIAEELPVSLRAVGNYDPEWFRTQLAALRKSLSE
jgi:hypothetical protein